MYMTELTFENFTVFGGTHTFTFAPGLNVFIGQNGAGKSHLLKAAYVLGRAVAEVVRARKSPRADDEALDDIVRRGLLAVFLPDSLESFALYGGGNARVTLSWERASLRVEITPSAVRAELVGDIDDVGESLFLPSREMLSVFPGFAAAWQRRESALDRTYFDLCQSLDLKPLREGAPAGLLRSLEDALEGKVIRKERGFYVEYAGGPMEAAMIGEGDRKLAMIAYLLMNGSLGQGGYVLWDEPEANLNPSRAKLMADLLTALSRGGTQLLVATHDYAFCSELSLNLDRAEIAQGRAAFFSLWRAGSGAQVSVERGAVFTDLTNNPILDALSGLHEREERAFADELGGGDV